MYFRLVFLFLVGLISIPALGQQQFFRQYGLENGLPQSQVFAVHGSENGFIWVGTQGGGLARFDGLEFEIFNTKQGLTDNFINALIEFNGKLWIATRSGLTVYKDNRFTQVELENSDAEITAIHVSGEKLLVGVENGIEVIDTDSSHRFMALDSSDGFVITNICNYKNEIWVGSNLGIYRLDAGDLSLIKTLHVRDGLADEYVQSLHSDGNSVWVGSYGRGLRYFNGETFSDLYSSLPANTVVHDLLLNRDSSLWVATQSRGVYVIDLKTGNTQQYSVQQGLSNNHVRSLSLDAWGNMWLGTSGGGLNQFSGQAFTHYTGDDGLKANYIYAVEQSTSGAIWIANGRKGVVQFDGNQFLPFALDSLVGNYKIKTIAIESDSSIWLGTEGEGLIYTNGKEIVRYTADNGLCGNYVKDLELSRGALWVATLDGGISKIGLGKPGMKSVKRYIRNYRYLTELPSNRIHALHRKGDVIWYGTEEKGFGYIDGKRIEVVVDETQIGGQNVRAIRSSGDDIWVATSNGLFRYGTTTKQLDTINSDWLTSTNLYLLSFDESNHLYVGHERGLDVLTINETGDVIESDYYGASDGFLGIETCQNACLPAQDGSMWFGTVNGLTRFFPSATTIKHGKPKVFLQHVNLFYEPLVIDRYKAIVTKTGKLKSPILNYDQNHLTFVLKGVDLQAPAKLQYQWWLEGFDKNWSPPGKKNEAVYSNLPPGEYVFHYKALSEDSESVQTASYSFSIEQPYWETFYFRFLMWFIPGLIIILLVWSYIRQIKKRAKREREKLEFDKELIELEQKALRLQMNPHFLFNALNSIQSLVALEQHKEARQYLQKFAKLMRLTLSNSRVDTIPLSDEIATLENYMALEQLSMKEPFTYKVDAVGINPDDVYLPPMMIQPFVENAIKHGLPAKGSDGGLSITFEQENATLICRVRDNGMGREAAIKKAKEKSKSHESAAIQVITDRIEMLNTEHPGNALQLIDHENGTEVVIRLVIE